MNPDEIALKDNVREVMQALPPVISAYLSQKKYALVAQNLMRTYGLRVDQGGVLEREIVFLLMGVETPNEFMEALMTEANIGKDIIDKIARDINTRIFIPLRAEEMKASAAPKAEEQGGTHFHLENKIPLPARPVANRPQPAVAPSPLKAALNAALDSSKLLEDHEEPHIEFGKPAVPPTRTAPPPPNLPGQMPSAPVAPRVIPPGASAAAPAAPAPAAKPASPTPPAGLKFGPPSMQKQPGRYAADPYREPIEEESEA